MPSQIPRVALAAVLALTLAPLSGCEEAPAPQKGPLVNPGPGPEAESARKSGAPAKKAPADPGPPSAAKP